ncbi:UNVERIFIED_ORG: hypothetical protein LHJ69_18290 [Shinella sp. XGS7]|nr:hypothetical protein [Shinella sp. XGS7]
MTYVDPRPLSSAELAVLQTVLAVAPTPHTPALQELPLENLLVHSQCDCGCASVGFLVEEDRPRSDTKLVADGLGLSAGNRQVGVIVYGSAGQVVELELHWPYDGGAPLPRPETIVPWERGREVTEAEQ